MGSKGQKTQLADSDADETPTRTISAGRAN